MKQLERPYVPTLALVGLLLITVLHHILAIQAWPWRTTLGEFVFGYPGWLIPSFCVFFLSGLSVRALRNNNESISSIQQLASAAICAILLCLAWHFRGSPERVPLQLRQGSDIRFVIMLLVISLVGLPIFLSAKRHKNLLIQDRTCNVNDAVLLFLLVLNVLLLAFSEVVFLSGRPAAFDQMGPLSFTVKYSDVPNVVGNPLFDIPRMFLTYAGVRYFSDVLICMYYGALSVTLFSLALSTLVSRQAAFAAAFCTITFKHFLMIVFSGSNVITALLAVSVGTYLLFWIAPALVARWSTRRLILAGLFLGLFGIGLLFGYAASRLPAIALSAVIALCLVLSLFKYAYSSFSRTFVLLAVFLAPCLYLALVYKFNIQKFQHDFFASTIPNFERILPERPSYIPPHVAGLSPDLPFVYGAANVRSETAPGKVEVRTSVWRRSLPEALGVAVFHTKNIFKDYTWFPGGILMWMCLAAGLSAMLTMRSSIAARGLCLVMFCGFGIVFVLPFFIVTSPNEWRRGCSVLLLFCGLGGIGVYTLLRLLFPRVSATYIAMATGMVFTSLSARASLASINALRVYDFGMQRACEYNPIRALLRDDVATRDIQIYIAGEKKSYCSTSITEALQMKLGRERVFHLPISRETSLDQMISEVPKGATVAVNCGKVGGRNNEDLCERLMHDPRARLIDELSDKSNNLWLLENRE